MVAAVLRPRRLVVTRVERPLFTVADGADAGRVDAERRQVLLRGVRAAVAEGEVVLLGAALVAVTFDQEVVLRVLLEPVGRSRESALRVRRERRLVVCEEGVGDVAALLRDAVELFDVARERLFLHRLLLHEVVRLRDGGWGHGRRRNVRSRRL